MHMFVRESKRLLWSGALMFTVLTGGCKGGSSDGGSGATISNAVSLTAPVHDATEVAINRKIAATFTEKMDSASLTSATFTITPLGGSAVEGTVAYVDATSTAVFTPTSYLPKNTVFTAAITTGAKNPAGAALANNYLWSFTTGASADTTAPSVISTVPSDGATGVAINGNVAIVFDDEVDASTLTATAFKVAGASDVSGTITYAGSTVTFNPTDNLAINTDYTVTLTTDVTDLAGNSLVSPLEWVFTTGSTTAKGPAPVILGTAGNFVVLAKSAVSTTGTTAVVGDVGLSPAAQSFLTGFSETLDATNQFATSSVVTGKLYASDMAVPTPANMTAAISNMETAYTDAAGRTLPDQTELGAGDISGMTLQPGLYKWGTGVLLSSDLTLSGSENDVWIFQVAQNLTVSNGVKVTLSGGALPKNIFWQVAGKATLGTTSEFKGVILSKTQIVMQTGAALSGRALAQTAVTMDANAVTQPAP